jgi:hypothetical protein
LQRIAETTHRIGVDGLEGSILHVDVHAMPCATPTPTTTTTTTTTSSSDGGDGGDGSDCNGDVRVDEANDDDGDVEMCTIQLVFGVPPLSHDNDDVRGVVAAMEIAAALSNITLDADGTVGGVGGGNADVDGGVDGDGDSGGGGGGVGDSVKMNPTLKPHVACVTGVAFCGAIGGRRRKQYCVAGAPVEEAR